MHVFGKNTQIIPNFFGMPPKSYHQIYFFRQIEFSAPSFSSPTSSLYSSSSSTCSLPSSTTPTARSITSFTCKSPFSKSHNFQVKEEISAQKNDFEVADYFKRGYNNMLGKVMNISISIFYHNDTSLMKCILMRLHRLENEAKLSTSRML